MQVFISTLRLCVHHVLQGIVLRASDLDLLLRTLTFVVLVVVLRMPIIMMVVLLPFFVVRLAPLLFLLLLCFLLVHLFLNRSLVECLAYRHVEDLS